MQDDTAMSRRVGRALWRTLASAVSVVSLCGCAGEPEPCPGVSVGNRYELVVGEAELARPAEQKCLDDWGFAAGTLFQAEIVRAGTGDGNGCRSGIPEVSGNSGWNLQLNSQQYVAGGLLLEGVYVISNDNCRGSAWLSAGCFDNCQYSAAPCACRLTVNLSGSEPGCPPICNVTAAVTVSRL